MEKIATIGMNAVLNNIGTVKEANIFRSGYDATAKGIKYLSDNAVEIGGRVYHAGADAAGAVGRSVGGTLDDAGGALANTYRGIVAQIGGNKGGWATRRYAAAKDQALRAAKSPTGIATGVVGVGGTGYALGNRNNG